MRQCFLIAFIEPYDWWVACKGKKNEGHFHLKSLMPSGTGTIIEFPFPDPNICSYNLNICAGENANGFPISYWVFKGKFSQNRFC